MRLALLAALAVIVLVPACAASGVGASRSGSGGGGSGSSGASGSSGKAKAMTLVVGEPAFGEARVVMAKSMPPQFTVTLAREMPTPGWSFEVDSVDVDEEDGRIVAKLSEIAPEGMSAQVITPATCRIPLGAVGKGRYLLEIWLRRGASGDHRLAQALVVDAR